MTSTGAYPPGVTDNDPHFDSGHGQEPQTEPTREEQAVDTWEYWHQRALTRAEECAALKRDIACRPGSTGLLYSIREALGFNHLYPLSHLDGDARAQRKALLACAPIAFSAIAEEKKDEIGNSDLDNEQPVTLTIRTTLGVVREARRALFVANIHPERKP